MTRRPTSASAGDGDQDLAQTVRPGWPDPLPAQLDWLQHRTERVAFSRAEVLALWAKAVRKLRDAGIAGVSTDTALETAYAAGRIGALAAARLDTVP